MEKPQTLRKKITFLLVFIFLAIILPSMFLLFERMNMIILENVRNIDYQWASQRMEALDAVLENMILTVSSLTEDDEVIDAFKKNASSRNALIEASDYLKNLMGRTSFSQYVNKMVIFNTEGQVFEYVNRVNGDVRDPYLIMAQEDYKSLNYKNGIIVKVLPAFSINDCQKPVITSYSKIRNTNITIYTEINASIFSDIFSDNAIDNFFIVCPDLYSYPEEIPENLLNSDSYVANYIKSSYTELYAVYFTPRRALPISSFYGISTLIMIVIAAGFLSIYTGVSLTNRITKPLARLNAHMLYLTVTNNYGQVNKDIEESRDEISSIGRTVNKMSVSIKALLDRNERLYEEKKNAEIAMLNMQINPHFLYNTLESIYYMASAQKAMGIANMSKGLSNLLRNMAKMNGERIPLKDEIKLLEAYDSIQQVRYMGMYDIEYKIPKELENYRIIKFTLQPLVENSIFHGIEPKGEYGVIRISAHKDDRYLYVIVEDDGEGMNEDELKEIYTHRSHEKTHMTGVGVSNVDERLKLTYGQECGLFYESEKGKGTRATVKLPLEE